MNKTNKKRVLVAGIVLTLAAAIGLASQPAMTYDGLCVTPDGMGLQFESAEITGIGTPAIKIKTQTRTFFTSLDRCVLIYRPGDSK